MKVLYNNKAAPDITKNLSGRIPTIEDKVIDPGFSNSINL